MHSGKIMLPCSIIFYAEEEGEGGFTAFIDQRAVTAGKNCTMHKRRNRNPYGGIIPVSELTFCFLHTNWVRGMGRMAIKFAFTSLPPRGWVSWPEVNVENQFLQQKYGTRTPIPAMT